MLRKMNRHLLFLITACLVVGISLFLYQWLWLDTPLKPTPAALNWLIEAKITYEARHKPVKIQFSIPDRQPNFVVLNENFISPNYGIFTKYANNNRYVQWTKNAATGKETLYYRIMLRSRHDSMVIDYPHIEQLPATTTMTEAESAAADMILREATEKSADKLSMVGNLLLSLHQQQNENASILLQGDRSNKRITEVAARLLAKRKILALPIQCLNIDERRSTYLIPWMMVKDNESWHYFDPTSAKEDLPKNFLIWHIGNGPLFDMSGGNKSRISLNQSTLYSDAAVQNIALYETSAAELPFSLISLPAQIQNMYKILLTIPLGALIILIFRNFIGLTTFGTFMPVLIALSLIDIQLAWGLPLYVLLISFGLLIRFYLEKLSLLAVPRLSAVLVLVILFMSFLAVLMNKLEWVGGTSAALFPIVILTMTIEKMCNLWDERGARESIRTGVTSLFIAVMAYFPMKQSAIQYLFFTFPELNLVVLALILWMGQYRGYRLSEIYRFRVLAAN